MSIETVKYGVAKEGTTKGDDSWAQDTEVCEEKNSAGYLAASLGSFAVALAVMNFWGLPVLFYILPDRDFW